MKDLFAGPLSTPPESGEQQAGPSYSVMILEAPKTAQRNSKDRIPTAAPSTPLMSLLYSFSRPGAGQVLSNDLVPFPGTHQETRQNGSEKGKSSQGLSSKSATRSNIRRVRQWYRKWKWNCRRQWRREGGRWGGRWQRRRGWWWWSGGGVWWKWRTFVWPWLRVNVITWPTHLSILVPLGNLTHWRSLATFPVYQPVCWPDTVPPLALMHIVIVWACLWELGAAVACLSSRKAPRKVLSRDSMWASARGAVSRWVFLCCQDARTLKAKEEVVLSFHSQLHHHLLPL